MEPEIATASTAFKKSTYRSVNPRNLLAKILDEIPDGSKHEWRDEFYDRVQAEPDHLRAVIDWWFDNNIVAATRPRKSEAGDRKIREMAAATELAVTLKKHIERKAKIILLDMMMPNGKELRHCTGSECNTFGGWFTALGERVGARPKVGSKMNEAAIQDFYDKHAQ